MPTKKSLGQHWLKDRLVLESIAREASITASDTVLEIGPGLGTLTSVLLSQAKQVIAVEFDGELARKLPAQFPGKALDVHHEDILQFDLSRLDSDYTVVANVPYYITSKIIQRLLTSKNPPKRAVLLVQKEVAERLGAGPGDMSVLALSAQLYADVTLGPVVPAEYFTPPPKVDSQVVILTRKIVPIEVSNEKILFRVIKAGFSSRRKKLRSSLSGGLRLEKETVERLLMSLAISPDARAEDLSVDDWLQIAEKMTLQ